MTKSFGSKRVVDNPNLTVPKGAIFALWGETAPANHSYQDVDRFDAAGQRNRQDSATRLLVCRSKLRRRMAYVPEKPRYYDWMTVAQIGWFTAGFHGEDYPRRYED